MDPTHLAEQAAIRAALERGYLDSERLAQARQLAAQPGSVGLLRVLAQRFLSPEQASALGQIYQATLSGSAGRASGTQVVQLPEGAAGTQVVQLPGPSVAVSSGPPPYEQTLATPPPSPGPAPESRDLAQAGDLLGPYRLIRELARGGMGVVYVAQREGLDRRVALKQLLDLGAGDAVERFLIEARIAARLRHPNIVGIHDVGQVGESPYFAMDYIEGEDLDQVLKRQGGIDPGRAALLTRKLAGALAYAHSRAVLHRDIKPANVLLTPDDEPVLTDFGLAKDVGAGRDAGLTKAGAIMGTPAYMPPEQADGKKDLIDRRADVYSLGGTLYAMLTGLPPFEGSSPLNTITKVLREEVVPPRKLAPGTPRDLEVICLKCLAKEPEERYATAAELEADLERFLADEPIQARPPSLGDRLEKWIRRNRALATLGVVAAGLLVVAAAAVFLGLRASQARAARLEAERALEVLEEIPPGASAERRLSSSLAALQAASRYRSAVGAESDPLYLQALLALGDAACEGRQLALAQQTFDEAAALAPGDTAVSERLANLTRLQNLRRDAVADILRAVREDDRKRFLEDSDPVFELVRYPEQRAELTSALDAVSARLLELQCELLRSGSKDRGALDKELESYQELCRSGERPSDAVVEGRFPAVARARKRLLGAAGGAATFGRLLRSHLGSEVAAERRVARVACQALGRIGEEAGDAIPAIQRYLAVEPKLQASIEACCALARIGTPQALEALRPHRGRIHDMRLDYLIGRAAERLGLQEEAADPETSRGQLLEQLRNAFSVNDLPQAIAFSSAALAQSPRDDLIRAWRAHALALHGDQEEAKADLELLSRRPQEDSAVLARIAFAQIQLGQPDLATTSLARAIELATNPERALELRIPYATTLLTTNRVALAEEQIAKALESGPNASAYALRGLINILRGDYERAEVAIKQALAIEPENADAMLGSARLAAKRGLAKQAAPLYARVLERRPKDPQVLSEMADVKVSLGNHEEALEDLGRALELCHSARERSHILGNRARCLTRLGRGAEARRDAEQVVQLSPESSSAWVLVGKLRLAEGDLEQTEVAVRRALDLAVSAEALALRAKLQVLRGQIGLALQDFDRALQLSPKDTLIRAERASTRAQAGQLAGALKDLDLVLSKEAGNVAALRVRAAIYASTGKLDEARADARRLAAAAPNRIETHLVKATVDFYGQSYQEALAAADAALALGPDEPQALNIRGQCLRMLGRPQEAVECMKRLLKVAPGKTAQIHLQLGACYHEAGDSEQAKAQLRLYLKKAPPNDPSRAQAKAVLSELEAKTQ